MTDSIKSILKSQKEKQDMMHGKIIKLNQSVFENLYGGMVFNASVNKAITETLKRVNKDCNAKYQTERNGQYKDCILMIELLYKRGSFTQILTQKLTPKF